MDETGAKTDAERLREAEKRIRELERQVAILYSRLTDRAESLPNLLPAFYRPDEMPVFDGRNEAPVDLVLTVKNTYNYLVPCLESLFKNTDVPFRLFLNDNASSDHRTPEYLRQVRDRHPEQVRLFLQDRDLGFADAVNLLLAETMNDVVLVNADTVLPPAWASRLLWPMRHSGETVGSCTPFTNSVPYVAFPIINQERDLFENMELEQLDNIMQAAKPTTRFVLPTGYGFCMAMSRAALDSVGLLDADTFRPAYCEEIDWCCRADAAGFSNLVVPNLFVYHRYGGTLKHEPDQLRERLRRKHIAIVQQRYPSLENRIHAFVDDPEYQAFRSYLLLLASVEAGGGLKVLFPGTTRCNPASDQPAMIITQSQDSGEYAVRFSYREWRASFTSPSLNWVIKLLYRLKIRNIRVGDLGQTADRDKIVHALTRLARHGDITVEMEDDDAIHSA